MSVIVLVGQVVGAVGMPAMFSVNLPQGSVNVWLLLGVNRGMEASCKVFWVPKRGVQKHYINAYQSKPSRNMTENFNFTRYKLFPQQTNFSKNIRLENVINLK